jgi:hypothetical protein
MTLQMANECIYYNCYVYVSGDDEPEEEKETSDKSM